MSPEPHSPSRWKSLGVTSPLQEILQVLPGVLRPWGCVLLRVLGGLNQWRQASFLPLAPLSHSLLGSLSLHYSFSIFWGGFYLSDTSPYSLATQTVI